MDAHNALDEARFSRLDALVARITQRLPGPDPAVFAYVVTASAPTRLRSALWL